MNSTLRNWLVGGVLFIAACDGQPLAPADNNQLVLPVPSSIREIATLDSLALEVQVTVNDDLARRVRVTDTEEITTTTVQIPENQSNDVNVGWYANIDSQSVLLADYTTTVVAGQTVLDVTSYIDSGVGYDADGDGRTNLVEAREGRSLISEFDLEVPLVPVGSSVGGVSAALRNPGNDSDLSGDITDQDAQTTFSLRHDGTDLIVYVCGKDQTVLGDNRETDGQYWHDDAVFIFIDGANSDNGSYDNFDDFQIAFLVASEEMIVSKGQNNPFCPMGSCIFHDFFQINGSCAYELTVSLPLADFNITPGTPVGFDIEITDDDNGNKRDSSSAWIGFDDQSNEVPGTFGTIILR